MIAVDSTPPVTDAYAIWLHARSAVSSAQYPTRIDYTIAVSGLDGGRLVADHYRASTDPGDGSIRVFPISDEQLAKAPPVPHGINFGLSISICIARGGCGGETVPVGHPAPYQDLLGEPLIAPTYMFGLRYAHVRVNAAPLPGESALPVIATVSAGAPDYRVMLIDTPTIDGVPTYHLALRPLRKPKDNRLRELWVGENDYLPRRASIAGNFTMAPLVDVPWSVDFAVIDGAPFVTSESTADPLYLPHRRVVHNAVIAFENIREPDATIYDQPLIEPDAAGVTLTEP